MTTPTPLDQAHAAMEAAPEDDAARLAFYDRLADTELFLLLKSEAVGDRIDPETVTLEGTGTEPSAPYLVVFDREDRLAAFADGPAPYAALPGRVVATMVAGSGLGLGLNLGVPSSILIPAEAVTWLAETLGPDPEAVEGQVSAIEAPKGTPEALLTSLSQKLAPAGGLASHALLVRAVYDDDTTGLVLAFIDAVADAEAPLARAAQEAVTFSGTDARLDVAFFEASDVVVERMSRLGLRLEMPKPKEPELPKPKAPGSDPNKPPILK